MKVSANIFSNDPENPHTKVHLTAFIRPYITIEPGQQVLFQGYPGEPVSKKVVITSFEQQPLSITGITSTIEDKIVPVLTTVEEGKIFTLELKTPAGLQEPFTGKLELQTNSQKKPKLEVYVKALLKKEIVVRPQLLFFGVIDTGKTDTQADTLTRKVQVTKVTGTGLTIEKIESSADWITTEIETNKEGEHYTIVVTLNKEKAPKGDLKEEIIIHTKNNTASDTVKVFVEAKSI